MRLLLTTPLSILFVLMFSVQLFASSSYSDVKKLNLHFEKVSIQEVFAEIEEQSEFEFFYNHELLDEMQREVQIKVEGVTIEKVLDQLFSGRNVGYEINGKHIIVTASKEEKASTESIKSLLAPQQNEVSGTVANATSGEPLPGVNITVRGTNTGTITNASGEYTIAVENPDEAVLLFSFVGYRQKAVPVNGRNTIDVALELATTELEEIAVVGYGIQRKSDVTGSVDAVSGEDIAQGSSYNALKSMRGKLSGVNVFTNSGAPGGSNRVMIRGIGTINASSNPLYVVDGVARDNIDNLNPQNIERMEVLKDASSTAIYGARGANGVILVTTKGGLDEQGVQVNYNSYVSIGQLRKKMDLLDADQWMEVMQRGYDNAPKYNDYPDGEEPVLTRDDPRLFDAQGNPRYDTDWQEEATRTAVSHNHQFSVRKGGENSSFGAFVNYSDNEGIVLNSWLKRLNAKISYSTKATDWLSFNMDLSANKIWENDIEEGGGHQMPRRSMIEMPPIFPVKFPDGEWSSTFTIEDDYGLEAIPNPVHVLQTQERRNDDYELYGNAGLTFHILPGLDFETRMGFDTRFHEWRFYGPKDLINLSAPHGEASISNSRHLYWQQENFLTYNKTIGDHRLNAVLGMSWQERTYRSNGMFTAGFAGDFLKYNNMGAAETPNPPSSYAERWAIHSYFMRAAYTLKGKYLLTFTGRADGSSRFGADNKYGYFPSGGIGWVVSNEDFFADNINAINYMKLRTSYGVTGNTEIGTYRSLATVGSGTVLMNGSRVTSSSRNRLANPELEWEKTRQFDAGLELGLFDDRIRMEVDYYYKLTDDLLLNRPVPHTTGFGSVIDNIGSVSNQGVDFSLTTRNFEQPGFAWTSSVIVNYNKNTIEALGENDEDIFPGPWWVSGSQIILRVGESLSSFWGYERLGTYNTDEAEEAAEVGAIPGEAKRSEEKKILGKGIPDFQGSFINRFSYKNFDLTLDLQFVYGVEILQQFHHSTEDRTGYASGLETILTEAWTPNNQNTMVQQIRNAPLSGQNSQIDSRWVCDGSYLRGNMLSFGYTFDEKILGETGIQNLRVYANVENFFVLHDDDFRGYDPEATSWGGNQWGQNIFFFQYPKPTTYTLGVNLRF